MLARINTDSGKQVKRATLLADTFVGRCSGSEAGNSRSLIVIECTIWAHASLGSNPRNVNGGDRKGIRPQLAPELRQSLSVNQKQTSGPRTCRE